jgi:hypothetical protein
MGKSEFLAVAQRLFGFGLVLAACTPAASEPPQEPVAVELPAPASAGAQPATSAPAGKGEGGASASVAAAFAGTQAVKTAAVMKQLGPTRGACPSFDGLVDERAFDPKHDKDPWGHAYRIVCDEDDIHVVSDGRDGVESTADDIRDDASEADLKRIGGL